MKFLVLLMSCIMILMANSVVRDNGNFSNILKRDVAEMNGSKQILMIQTNLPWDSDANMQVMEELGYGYDLKGWGEIDANILTQYPIVLIVNDQGQQFYEDYSANKAIIENWIKNGGTLMFFSASDGWAGGSLNDTLPGNVHYFYGYDPNNVINPNSSYVQFTGLTNEDLYGNYCSHGYYDDNETLYNNPEISNVALHIFSKEYQKPTTISYNLGKGYVFASTITWEYGYTHVNDEAVGPYATKALRKTFEYVINHSTQISPPKVFLDANPKEAEINTSITFIAQAEDRDGYIVSYEWDFDGDGIFDENTSTNQISHVYNILGEYNVTVKVYDNDGYYGISKTAVMVKEDAIEVSVYNATLKCKENNYTQVFNIEVEGNYSGTFEWDFDEDGQIDKVTSVSDKFVTHEYKKTGEYYVQIFYNNQKDKELIKVKDCNQAELKLLTSHNIASKPQGWHLMGSSGTIGKDIFTSVKILWIYRNGEWAYFIPSENKESDIFPIRPYEGFWILKGE